MAQSPSSRRSRGGDWSSEGAVRSLAQLSPGDATAQVLRHQPGDVIDGKYRIVDLLGRGGAGEVFRAHHEVLDVDVALKVLHPESGWTDAAERFLKEARAAAKLEHPAIARTVDFGQSKAGEPFLVMELLEGEDLALALSKQKRFQATAAVRTLLPIASALSLAHSRGIVHRDLKPENVFLARTEDDRMTPKIVDFGIAKLEGDISAKRLTQTGELLGSPVYMSPEQARGEDVDQRGDVWAFSVVLYEMIAGRAPFSGDNYNAVIHEIVTAEPASIEGIGGADEALWAVIRQGLAKDPEERWQSMHDLGEVLAKWLLARGIREDVAGASLERAFRTRSSGFPEPPSNRAPSPSQPLVATLPPRADRAQSSRRRLNLGAALALLFAIGFVLWNERETRDSAAPDASRSAATTSSAPVSSGTSDVLVHAEPVAGSSASEPATVDGPPAAASASQAPVPSLPAHGKQHRRLVGRSTAPKASDAALQKAIARPTAPESGLKDPFQ